MIEFLTAIPLLIGLILFSRYRDRERLQKLVKEDHLRRLETQRFLTTRPRKLDTMRRLYARGLEPAVQAEGLPDKLNERSKALDELAQLDSKEIVDLCPETIKETQHERR